METAKIAVLDWVTLVLSLLKIYRNLGGTVVAMAEWCPKIMHTVIYKEDGLTSRLCGIDQSS